jgi:hypothetical protein
MLVMPANSTGWFWTSLARETGRIGHLYSPGGKATPRPWFPYAIDCGVYACWDQTTNTIDMERWEKQGRGWRRLLFWAQSVQYKAKWAIVPDVPGNAKATVAQWPQYAPTVERAGIPLAVAVQDGMTPDDVRALAPAPVVVCVGGSTDWKWHTAEMWLAEFPRVHVLRCNIPERLYWLEERGCESTDGTGWNRGNRAQTEGVEAWARSKPSPSLEPLWPHTCRESKTPWQLSL